MMFATSVSMSQTDSVQRDRCSGCRSRDSHVDILLCRHDWAIVRKFTIGANE